MTAILRNVYLLLVTSPFLKNFKFQILSYAMGIFDAKFMNTCSCTWKSSQCNFGLTDNTRSWIVGYSKTQGRLTNYFGDQQVQRELEKFAKRNRLKKNSYCISLSKEFTNEFIFPSQTASCSEYRKHSKCIAWRENDSDSRKYKCQFKNVRILQQCNVFFSILANNL